MCTAHCRSRSPAPRRWLARNVPEPPLRLLVHVALSLIPHPTSPNIVIMPTDFENLTSFQVEQMVLDMDLRAECKKLFNGQTSLHDLRASCPLGRHDTPASADCDELAQYTWSKSGAGAEALAMTLWHLAAEKRVSGKEIDRYRDAAQFAWKCVSTMMCSGPIYSQFLATEQIRTSGTIGTGWKAGTSRVTQPPRQSFSGL